MGFGLGLPWSGTSRRAEIKQETDKYLTWITRFVAKSRLLVSWQFFENTDDGDLTQHQIRKRMASPPSLQHSLSTHKGPHPGILATVHVLLFIGSILQLVFTTHGQGIPNPFGPVQQAQQNLFTYLEPIKFNTFLQFCAALPLGLFAAAVTSRLQFLGITAAGVNIALVGGIASSIFMIISALSGWILTQPGIADNLMMLNAIQFFGFTTGGLAYSVGFGLLIAGVSVPCLLGKLTPKWIPIMGLVLAAAAQLSTLSLLFYPANFLLPVVRFGGFLWMIAVGFTLPKQQKDSPQWT